MPGIDRLGSNPVNFGLSDSAAKKVREHKAKAVVTEPAAEETSVNPSDAMAARNCMAKPLSLSPTPLLPPDGPLVPPPMGDGGGGWGGAYAAAVCSAYQG